MGGIREKGFFLSCDRCSKDREITEESQISFYKKFRDRKERSSKMFMSMLVSADGEKVAGFEWLCPDCVSAIATYLGKAAPEKSADAPKGKGKGKGKDKDQAPPPASDDKTTVTAADEPDRDAAPEATDDEDSDESGDDVNDNELFD